MEVNIGDFVKLKLKLILSDNNFSDWFGITNGKLYRVLNLDPSGKNVLIKNDEGFKTHYPTHFFKSITRQQKLERILNENR